MILILATRYRKYVAFLLFYIAGVFLNLEAMANGSGLRSVFAPIPAKLHSYPSVSRATPRMASPIMSPVMGTKLPTAGSAPFAPSGSVAKNRAAIDGPTQPEMNSFKSVNSKNMVNLFTGSFSYNIPLLDVGGYPVNIYYNGEIGMEQEASWVGLGWNINPGSITRNMRGIPDDFNGKEKLEQQQNVKPNHTFGITLGPDFEWNGLSHGVVGLSGGISVGVSWNNYLGPALNMGIKGGLAFHFADKVLSEKGNLKLGAGISANIGSRSGFSLSPNVSLTANLFDYDRMYSAGGTLATTYNSREGIKALQISEQVSANRTHTIINVDDQGLHWHHYSSPNSIEPHSSAITFARPSYIPAIRMPMLNSNYSGNFQVGGALFGAMTAAQGEIFDQKSQIDPVAMDQKKPMVGYLFYDVAKSQPDMITDFTRFNDREVTPNTPIISAPQYTYDVFTIQGEGTGGSIRAFRNDLGSVRDNLTGSKDVEDGLGVDIGIPGQYGLNVNMVKTPTTIGEWTNGNLLKTAMSFDGPATTGSYENVYFRNPGEGTVLDNQAYTRIGGTDLVRFKLIGDPHNPGIGTNMDRFLPNGASNGSINPATSQISSSRPRQRRTQVVDFLNAYDASIAGLDTSIYSYSPTLLGSNNMLTPPQVIKRYDNVIGNDKAPGNENWLRWDHHISQISVTEDNGKRYIYGLPVYNKTQSEYTFSVPPVSSPENRDTVNYTASSGGLKNGENTIGSPDLLPDSKVDGYVQVSTTPGYAHSFLLTGLLSPDYVDVTGNGITEDDLGQAVKFNYTRMTGYHRWRTPQSKDPHIANFNPGNLTYDKDDKGIIAYGERESWYLHSIESKNLVAVFTLKDRHDGKGVSGPDGAVDPSDTTIKALQQIDLYSKSDLRQHGLAAKPIKTVHFVYGYDLCVGTPDNINGTEGKLTLKSIYFTYNGQDRSNKDQYVFSYTRQDSSGNPAYARNASDRWGAYKPTSMNPDEVMNSYFPYTPQDQPNQEGQAQSPKATLDANAGAWSLKRILLPSGGQLEIGYETKDYAYVQNARAMDMFSIAGFGNAATSTPSNHLFDITGGGTIVENPYLFIKVPIACSTLTDVYAMYLQGVSQIAVKLDVNMPAGNERITSYATIDYSNPNNPGQSTGSFGYIANSNIIWVKLKEVNSVSPLSLSTIEFLKDRLPKQAFPGYDVSETAGLDQVAGMLKGWLSSLTHAFGNPVDYLRSQHKAQTVQLTQCFARLDDPDEVKYGGGQRVSYITLKDNWDKMGKTFLSSYTQTYDYTTTETFEGRTRKISSGVASYEPGIGGDENPFQTIVQVEDKLPLGPASYGAVEMPILEAFFPAPTVGYSEVTVRSVSSIPVPQGSVSRSAIGRQVTKFYTAKDFPVYYANTGLDPSTDYQAHESSTTNFFYKYAFDARAISQGFLVATNDMHGMLRSEASYPAGQDTTQLIGYKEYYYRNTGVSGMNETFPFVSSKQGGVIRQGNMGIDIELMTDTRQFTVKSNGLEVQAQVDLYPVLLPVWLPFIWPVTANSENDYRAVTTTKVINYHNVLDSIVAYDKGSKVSTKNLLYDGETGQVISTRTINEFNEPIYSTAYPAWWSYDGMGPAYLNTGELYISSATNPVLNFTDGRLVGGNLSMADLVSGDELQITSDHPLPTNCSPASAEKQVWVMDLNKNNAPSFPAATPNFIFIDKKGNPYNNTNVTAIRIIRSGRRNMLDEKVAAVTSLISPIVTNDSVQRISLGASSMVLNATALEYSEKWQTDQDEIGRFNKVYDQSSCSNSLVQDCHGQLEASINPYRKGLLGTFRPSRTMVFYGNRNNSSAAQNVNLSTDGYLANFGLYWDFSGAALAPNTSSTLWVESNRVTRTNAQGLQLETKNALGIYTAAQYGFNKTLPLAITNNSAFSHTAYAGFEDFGFNQSIDGWQPYPCSTEPIDFAQVGTVVPTDSLGFHAHTGRNVLRQPGSTLGIVQLPIVSGDATSYNLSFGTTTPQVLANPGINSSFTPATSGSGGWVSANTSAVPNAVTVNTQIQTWTNPTTFNQFSWDGYIVINAKATYNFYLLLGSNFNLGVDQLNQLRNKIQLTIQDVNNSTNFSTAPTLEVDLNAFSVQQSVPQGNSATYPVVLCPGIYHLTCTGSAVYQAAVADNANLTYQVSCGNCQGPIYMNTATQSGCTTTTGIAGDPSMMNPLFSMPAGVPMVLSAWVHETAQPLANGADTSSGWYNNQISVSGVTETQTSFVPKGPMIDGWQRYEAKFTPAASGNVTIRFINNTSNNIYWDDIRVHPFHAEMKSYVYNPVNMRLVAELDANNYATFYEYDEEGTPVRTKAETQRGIQTIKETRSAKQKNLTTVQ